jgi:hypothetical protein
LNAVLTSGPRFSRRIPAEGVVLVLSPRHVQVIDTEAARPVARENQRVVVWREKGAVIVGRGIDVDPKVERRTPGSVQGGAFRDVDVEPAEASGPVGGEVKTETSL